MSPSGRWVYTLFTLATRPNHPTREAIIEASAEVFSRQGVAKTNVQDLLLAAKVSRRTFYKYFANKDEVLSALYESMTGLLVDVISGSSSSLSLDHVMLGIDGYLDFHLENTALLQVLIEQAMRSDSLLHARRTWFRKQLVTALQRTAASVSGKNVEALLLYGLLSMIEGMSLHLLEQGCKPKDIERAKQTIHRLAHHLLS